MGNIMKNTQISPRRDYYRSYFQTRLKMKQNRGGYGNLSEYGKFFFAFLGFNFFDPETKKILTKREYFDRYGDSYLPGWKLIPWRPGTGWLNEAEKQKHFEMVQVNYKDAFNEIFTYEN